MKNDAVIKELGKAYADRAPEFLIDQFGPKAELRDIETFYISAISWIASNAFVLTLRKAGGQSAEGFLVRMMSGISSNLRLRKIPYLAKLSAELTPIEGEPMPEEGPAPATQPAAPSDTCACPTKDGICTHCPEELEACYLDFYRFILEYLENLHRKSQVISQGCGPCIREYADGALTAVFEKNAGHGPESEIRRQALGITAQTLSMMGLELPKTEAAAMKINEQESSQGSEAAG